MFRLFRIDFPALDRLMDYLESVQQAEIDALKKKVDELTAALTQSRNKLEDTIEKET